MEVTQTPQKSKLRELLEAFPIIQFIGAGVIGLCATWTTIQLSDQSQAAEIRRNSEKIERLEKESVPREVFDERTKSMLDQLKDQSGKLDRILEKQK